jgi:hypothetical protein
MGDRLFSFSEAVHQQVRGRPGLGLSLSFTFEIVIINFWTLLNSCHNQYMKTLP